MYSLLFKVLMENSLILAVVSGCSTDILLQPEYAHLLPEIDIDNTIIITNQVDLIDLITAEKISFSHREDLNRIIISITSYNSYIFDNYKDFISVDDKIYLTSSEFEVNGSKYKNFSYSSPEFATKYGDIMVEAMSKGDKYIYKLWLVYSD